MRGKKKRKREIKPWARYARALSLCRLSPPALPASSPEKRKKLKSLACAGAISRGCNTSPRLSLFFSLSDKKGAPSVHQRRLERRSRQAEQRYCRGKNELLMCEACFFFLTEKKGSLSSVCRRIFLSFFPPAPKRQFPYLQCPVFSARQVLCFEDGRRGAGCLEREIQGCFLFQRRENR